VFDLYNYSLPTTFLVGVAAILAAIEIGRLLGVSAADRSDDNVSKLEDDSLSTLESAADDRFLPSRWPCRASRLGATRF